MPVCIILFQYMFQITLIFLNVYLSHSSGPIYVNHLTGLNKFNVSVCFFLISIYILDESFYLLLISYLSHIIYLIRINKSHAAIYMFTPKFATKVKKLRVIHLRLLRKFRQHYCPS